MSEGIRTPDIQDHNLALCQLSYAHHRHLAVRPGHSKTRAARGDIARLKTSIAVSGVPRVTCPQRPPDPS